MYKKYLLKDPVHIAEIEKALLGTYFSDYDKDFLASDEGLEDIKNNVYRRYNHALEHVIPWIDRYVDLAGKNVLEIGCGTGSSTAALAHFAEHVTGYDIHELSVQGARLRMEIMGLKNVALHVVEVDSLVDCITGDPKTPFDIILLFAVLEHQTVEERIATLRTCWQLLSEGGLMVIVDTPNLLCYFDAHTSRLPFLHMLPSRLYALYASRSGREGFNTAFLEPKNISAEELDVEIARWARGVSFHDFEIALGDVYKNSIVSHGFEPEILEWFAVSIEECLLRWYVAHKNLDIPIGFTRWILNLILQKNGGSHVKKASAEKWTDPYLFLKASELEGLRHQLQEKDRQIADIYQSKTYRMGNLMATPYRKCSRLLSLLSSRSRVKR